MAKKDNKTKKQENNKNKKSFFKDFKAELKKVIWPTPKQLVNNTVAVITIVLITAVIVFVLDIIFETANKQGIEKIKSVVTTTENTTSDNNATEENTTSEENTTNQTTESENNSTEETNMTESNTENTNTEETNVTE